MQRQQGIRNGRKQLLTKLDGESCAYCTTGTLTRAVFKSDDAVVCDDCGTPAARIW